MVGDGVGDQGGIHHQLTDPEAFGFYLSKQEGLGLCDSLFEGTVQVRAGLMIIGTRLTTLEPTLLR